MKSTETLQKIQNFESVCAILERNGNQSSRLIPILQEVQAEYGYLPEEVMDFIATTINVPASRVFGVATFYAHFSLEPKGKYIVKTCDGTACHVRGSMDIDEAVRERLGLTGDQNTTDDMLFTIETVSCLGACGLAPVVMVNEDVHGQMTPETTVELIETIIEQEVS